LADDYLAAVSLIDVDVQRRRHDDVVEPRLEPLGHERLKRVGDDRQLDAGQVGDGRAPAGGGVDHRGRGDHPSGGDHAGDAAVLLPYAGDLGEGLNLSPHSVGPAGVPPDDGVVADDAARGVVQPGEDRLVRAVAHVEAGDEVRNL